MRKVLGYGRKSYHYLIDKGSYGKSGRSDWLPIYKAGANIRIGTSAEMRRPLFKLEQDDIEILRGILNRLGY